MSKVSQTIRYFLNQNKYLVNNPEQLVEEAQDWDLSPIYINELVNMLLTSHIDFNADVLYPQFDDIRAFDYPTKSYLDYFKSIQSEVHLSEPIRPETFQLIKYHANCDDLWFKTYPSFTKLCDIWTIKSHLMMETSKDDSFCYYMYGKLDFCDRRGAVLADALIDPTKNNNQFLFGVWLPNLGYAINYDKAYDKLKKEVNNIKYLAQLLKD